MKSDVSPELAKAIIIDFLQRCQIWTNEQEIPRRTRQVIDDLSAESAAKLWAWLSYRQFTEHTIDELHSGKLDHWFQDELKSTFPPLLRLRIPSGWHTVRHLWWDASISHPAVAMLFGPSMATFIHPIPAQRDARYLLEVSWVPEGDPHGKFRLTAQISHEDLPLRIFEHIDRFRVREQLETWAFALTECPRQEADERIY